MNKHIVIFPLLTWDSELLHRDQALAKEFAKAGVKTYFINRVTRKPWKIFSSLMMAKIDGVNVALTYCLPYFHGRIPIIYRINNFLLGRQLKKLNKIITGTRTVFVTNPDWDEMVLCFKNTDTQIVYDISDDYVALAKNDVWKKIVNKHENRVVDLADKYVTTSPKLFKKIKKPRPHLMISNGVSVSGFADAKPMVDRGNYRKIAGFIGGIYEWVDLDLIKNAAMTYTDVLFLLVGPSNRQKELSKLCELANVQYIGPVPKEEVANYYASFDVGLVPFVSEKEYPRLTTVDSGKIYQYLYFGYPVVSTDFTQVRNLLGLVNVAKNTEEFIVALGTSLDKPKNQKNNDFATENSWEKKAKEILRFIYD